MKEACFASFVLAFTSIFVKEVAALQIALPKHNLAYYSYSVITYQKLILYSREKLRIVEAFS